MFKLILERQRNERSNCQHSLDHGKSKRVPEKHLFLLIDYAKAFDCVDHNNLWKILKETGIPDHLTCLLRNLYAGLLLLLSRFSHLRLCATPKMAALEAPLPLGFSRQEVRKQHLELDGTTDWFQIRKGVCHCCILSPCFFNFYVEYIMRNAGLEEAQAGIKIAGRNINNLRYADDITLMAESEEELKSLLMKVKVESEKLA